MRHLADSPLAWCRLHPGGGAGRRPAVRQPARAGRASACRSCWPGSSAGCSLTPRRSWRSPTRCTSRDSGQGRRDAPGQADGGAADDDRRCSSSSPSSLIVRRRRASWAAGRGEMNLERWSVGGRRFGVILVWLLMAGEIYTTFTFLGASGWAYSRGAPAFYILAYGTIGYIISFFMLPPRLADGEARAACTRSPTSSSRATAARRSPAWWRSSASSSIVPYLQLQLAGLGMIVETGERRRHLLGRRHRRRVRADDGRSSTPAA